MPHKETTIVVDGLNVEQPVKRDRHPPWYPPTQTDGNGLVVLNSLTESLEAFSPREGRLVKWYTCGPTVYDLSHMGHARAYLTFDIIRRIMEDYFGYSVIYQMNITDIDDKIIKRARINKLLADFKKSLQGKDVTALASFSKDAIAAAEAALGRRKTALSTPLTETDGGRAKAEREEKLLELQLKMDQMEEAKRHIAGAAAAGNFEALFTAASGVNGDFLDERDGHNVIDQDIFEDHARYYERAFFEDMTRLGIRPPDIVTRVTEYVPQVVEFVQKIIDNGFAYVGESSVFFDTEAYIKAGHAYPKLKAGGNKNTTADEMAEGEGALSKAVEGEKRSTNDFALWKFSKAGEPRWPSPWGEGRPGWHIECSVMASDILGENMDIHSGGMDLKFPHHDNECAQSEACNGHHQWVNYFLHCVHLHIKGLKMSKSLKNFVTIRQALDELGVTPRTMRLLFLANYWHKPMNFSDQSLEEAKERERILRAFFGSVHIVLRGEDWKEVQGVNQHDRELLDAWTAVEQVVHNALKNNFDTPTALTSLLSLVSLTNRYLGSEARPSTTLLRKVSRYITRMFQIFGVAEGTDDVGFSKQTDGNDQRLICAVDALTRFRDEVRDAAKENNAVKTFLPLCDALRDEWLVDAGIRLEDDPNGPTTWKMDDPVILRRERMERQQLQACERRRKLTNQLETKRKLVDKWSQCTYEPREYFVHHDAVRAEKKYAAFDPLTGMPSKLVSGEDVTEKELKKLQKEVAKYEKVYEEFMTKGGPSWLADQEREMAVIQKELDEAQMSN